jgi:hypothetical protein
MSTATSESPRSPFPGMDPYLEAHWGDVHTRLITYAANQLRPRLPEGLKARLQEYVAVTAEESDDRSGYFPDVAVLQHRPASSSSPEPVGGVTLAEPLVVARFREEQISRELRIIDTKSGGALVTTIEILSPANKTPSGVVRFRRKQTDLLAAGSNLVEVDLLREGRHAIAIDESRLPLEYREPYRVCVVEALNPADAMVYRVPLRERLPTIRIPLRYFDETPVALDLQDLLDRAYLDGDYSDTDYSVDPVPPLEGEDGEWAAGLLASTQRR